MTSSYDITKRTLPIYHGLQMCHKNDSFPVSLNICVAKFKNICALDCIWIMASCHAVTSWRHKTCVYLSQLVDVYVYVLERWFVFISMILWVAEFKNVKHKLWNQNKSPRQQAIGLSSKYTGKRIILINDQLGSFLTPEFLFLVPFRQFLRFYRQIFSSCSFFIVVISSLILSWNVMTWRHDMTSKCDVMAWNDIISFITSEAPSSISWFYFFLKRTNLDYKMVSSQAVTSWHVHDAMSWRTKHWLFHHSTISGSRRDRAKIFFISEVVLGQGSQWHVG